MERKIEIERAREGEGARERYIYIYKYVNMNIYVYIYNLTLPSVLSPPHDRVAHSQVNYLMESLYLPDPKPPVGIIDLGGGSVQIVYETPSHVAAVSTM